MQHLPDLPSEVSPEEPVPMPLPQVSEAELAPAARIGAFLFKNRGWLPILFLGIPLFARGDTAGVRWLIGGLLLVLGELFRLAGVAAAGTTTRRRSRRVQNLVTYGIFSWTRNPLYIGNFFVWVGFCVISGVLWFLPFAVLIFAAEYSFIVRFEEGVLESTFGRQYLDYKNCVPRWLPKKPDEPAPGDHDWRGALKSEISTFIQYAVLIVAFAIKGYLTR